MKSSTTFDWQKYRLHLKEILLFLPHYFRSPVQSMRSLPNWEWTTILLLHGLFGALVGLVSGVLKANLLSVLFNPIISAVSALLIGILGAAFLFYFSLFYLNRKLDLQRLYVLVALASLPMLSLRVLSFIGSPINLIGFFVTCLLTVVGLVENFAIERKIAIRLMGGVFALFFVFWVAGVVVGSRSSVDRKESIKPESMDQLQREMKSQDR